MDLRKTDRGCFGSKEFSSKNLICTSCLDFELCAESRASKLIIKNK